MLRVGEFIVIIETTFSRYSIVFAFCTKSIHFTFAQCRQHTTEIKNLWIVLSFFFFFPTCVLKWFIKFMYINDSEKTRAISCTETETQEVQSEIPGSAYLTVRVTEPWLPKKAVESPSLRIFKSHIKVILDNLFWFWAGTVPGGSRGPI